MYSCARGGEICVVAYLRVSTLDWMVRPVTFLEFSNLGGDAMQSALHGASSIHATLESDRLLMCLHSACVCLPPWSCTDTCSLVGPARSCRNSRVVLEVAQFHSSVPSQ